MVPEVKEIMRSEFLSSYGIGSTHQKMSSNNEDQKPRVKRHEF